MCVTNPKENERNPVSLSQFTNFRMVRSLDLPGGSQPSGLGDADLSHNKVDELLEGCGNVYSCLLRR